MTWGSSFIPPVNVLGSRYRQCDIVTLEQHGLGCIDAITLQPSLKRCVDILPSVLGTGWLFTWWQWSEDQSHKCGLSSDILHAVPSLLNDRCLLSKIRIAVYRLCPWTILAHLDLPFIESWSFGPCKTWNSDSMGIFMLVRAGCSAVIEVNDCWSLSTTVHLHLKPYLLPRHQLLSASSVQLQETHLTYWTHTHKGN